MNNVNLTGRIGQDPQVHTFDNGEKQTSFSIAVDNGYYSKDKNEWIDRTIWINIVKRGETKLLKGDLIEVSGKINVRDYEKEGNKIYVTEIIAFNTGLLSRKEIPKEHTQQPNEETGNNTEEISNESDLPFIITILLAVGSLVTMVI